MLEIFDIPSLIATYGYLGVGIIVFLESGIFFALPGDSLLFTAGILASADLISISLIIPVIFFSTFFGSVVGYHIGVYIEKLRHYRILKSILKTEHIEKAGIFFKKHGKITMLISRFVPIVRTFVPIVAGIAKMNYNSFLKWNLFGSFLWANIMTLLGYFLGKIMPGVIDYAHYFIIGVVLVSLIPLFLKKK
ncbi:hypothetical protein A2914_02645 [Candidatus Nomurabacteria bacterium RIFCSPLOWO2_01_FULL_41_21]|uniref:VTT domain-containing protein n=2 Tax=Candidatus Nomuraibacteriota TaxID=1752729 RepID=A0A1F6V1J2_9BACT|nr:MAG: hypothetical protein A2733_00420 [Candidatus Nomurabacteria bacterium RIFCSPHIGHO2_01_FULL_40_20]OGI88893.1 MAG: hypothetical protein A2914_02645 [Candidatus Nomurabacteria bacterium RIFCSPLOWO2_01_FULL_41_21]